MTSRQNVYTYPTADDDYYDSTAGPQRVGHFDLDRATRFPEGKRWDGNNNISLATGSQWGHQALYRTAGGKWVLNNWSQWQGSRETWEYADADSAREWLLLNEYGPEDVARETGTVVPDEETVYGRPEVGPQVVVRMAPSMREAADEAALEAGVTRAEWIRRAVQAAL